MAIELEIDGDLFEFENEAAMRNFMAKRQGKQPQETSSVPAEEKELSDIEAAKIFLKDSPYSPDRIEAFVDPLVAGFTGGLSERAQDSGNFLLNLLKGDDKTFEDVSEGRRQKQSEQAQLLTGGEGAQDLLELTGALSPLGVPAKLFGFLSKAPLIKQGLQSRGFLNTLLKGVPATVARGTGFTAASEAIDPDVDLETEDVLTGGAVDTALMAGGRTGKSIAKGSKSVTSFIKNLLQSGNLGQAARRTKGEQVLDAVDDIVGQQAFSKGSKGVTEAGQEFQKTAKEGFKLESDNFNKFVDGIFKKIGGKKVTPQKAQDSINKNLKKLRLLDDRGNIDEGRVEDLFGPDQKREALRLIEQSRSFIKSPTIEKLNIVKKGLGELSKFGKKGPIKGSEAAFRETRHAIAKQIEDEVEQRLGKAVGQRFRAANKRISDVLNLKENGFVHLLSENPDKAISTLTNKLQPGQIEQAIKLSPVLTKAIRKASIGLLNKKVLQPGNSESASNSLRKLVFDLGDQNVKAIFGPEIGNQLRKMANIKDPGLFKKSASQLSQMIGNIDERVSRTIVTETLKNQQN